MVGTIGNRRHILLTNIALVYEVSNSTLKVGIEVDNDGENGALILVGYPRTVNMGTEVSARPEGVRQSLICTTN